MNPIRNPEVLLFPAILFAASIAILIFVPRTTGNEKATAKSYGENDSVAAWEKVATVLQHPRCLNCHQLQAPLQGDGRRVHIPHVVRGKEDSGVGAMRCGNCHNDMGNNDTSRVPGGPHWKLAPVSMLWQGLSVGDLCRAVKDPARNGNRTGAMIVEHMEREPLVLYGWNPGRGREPVPMPHEELVKQSKIWVDGGMPCPK
jgi:hypothetical protein